MGSNQAEGPKSRLGRTTMMVLAVTLHNIPEGMAVGVMYAGFWQLLVILSVMNLIDHFLIDGYWVGHTSAWEIPGTEDLKPYITAKDKGKKWLFGTVGMAVIAAVLAGIIMFLMES